MPRAASALLLLGMGCTPDPVKETPDTAADTAADTGGLPDSDGDGFSTAEDCDDTDAAINPAAAEVCDGIDNDCDGLVDDRDGSLDASGGFTAYPDADEDGFGDQDAGEAVCALPDGWTTDGSDCDDTDAEIRPGAVEVCDGVNNDCLVSTAQSGMASWVDASGVLTDWTAALQPTGPEPLALALDAPGTLYLCEGEWPLVISVTADVSIVAPGGPEKTTISAGGAGRVLEARSGAVSLSGATISGGVGAGELFGFTYGGGVLCEGSSSVVLSGVILRDNTAGIGGGMYSTGCDVSLQDTTIEANTAAYAAGGLAIFDGNARIERSTFTANAANYGGGGVMVRTSEGAPPAFVDLIDTVFEANTAEYGSGLYIPSGQVSCSGDSGGKNGGFYRHTSGAGAVYLEGGGFDANRCDFGARKSNEDNAPYDVATDFDGYIFDDDETFACTEADGCSR